MHGEEEAEDGGECSGNSSGTHAASDVNSSGSTSAGRPYSGPCFAAGRYYRSCSRGRPRRYRSHRQTQTNNARPRNYAASGHS